MSQLDAWLFDNFQLSRGDLRLNIEKIADNASRYSKENTLTREKSGVDEFTDIEAYVDAWVDEVARSIEEDEQGVYRQGEDMQIADAIAEASMVLRKLGPEASLDNFPFKEIPREAQQFVCRALQKELSASLFRARKINMLESAIIYADKGLTGILEGEF